MTKPERPQEIALAPVKPFTHAAYLGLVSAVVDAGVLVDNYKHGCTTLIETLNSKKWNQEQNILLMSSLNVLLLLMMKN